MFWVTEMGNGLEMRLVKTVLRTILIELLRIPITKNNRTLNIFRQRYEVPENVEINFGIHLYKPVIQATCYKITDPEMEKRLSQQELAID